MYGQHLLNPWDEAGMHVTPGIFSAPVVGDSHAPDHVSYTGLVTSGPQRLLLPSTTPAGISAGFFPLAITANQWFWFHRHVRTLRLAGHPYFSGTYERWEDNEYSVATSHVDERTLSLWPGAYVRRYDDPNHHLAFGLGAIINFGDVLPRALNANAGAPVWPYADTWPLMMSAIVTGSIIPNQALTFDLFQQGIPAALFDHAAAAAGQPCVRPFLWFDAWHDGGYSTGELVTTSIQFSGAEHVIEPGYALDLFPDEVCPGGAWGRVPLTVMRSISAEDAGDTIITEDLVLSVETFYTHGGRFDASTGLPTGV